MPSEDMMSCNFSGLPQLTGLIPEGSLYSVAVTSSPTYDDRWFVAELRTTELLSRIQPNGHSEKRRKAVADYVKRLIHKCFDCQVFTFGSVPLKTYLPDGDIDLTAFSRHQSLKDSWATHVQSILEDEEHKRDAEFCVRDVHCINAEVKIIKCLVENIVVDISFNQLGGLCTLCFLEEVDRLIGRDHLFKRSIILVKSWCYYESRLLGAHHGLISTYALETLVLYIFNVFHTSLRGPLEVLFIFLDYFSNFDWEKYCVSLWGPVLLSSIPDLTAEPPRTDGGELLLSKDFLEACSDAYAVFPKGQDTQSRTLVEKYLNVVDPLRTNNNLGRSVSKANFFRIRSAFNLGARKMAKVFESSEEDFVKHLDNFFLNTWKRHQSGQRPDAPDSIFLPFQTFDFKNQSLQRIHGGSRERSNVLEHQNTGKSHFTDKSEVHSEGSQQTAEALVLQSTANNLVGFSALGGEAANLKSEQEAPLDSSSYVEEVLNLSENLSSYDIQTNEAKQDKPKMEENLFESVDFHKKKIPSRSRSLGRGSCMTQESVEKSKFQMRRSTSDGRLGELTDVQVLKGSRLLGDAHDLASVGQRYSAPVENEPVTVLRKNSGPIEGPKILGWTDDRIISNDDSGFLAMNSAILELPVKRLPSIQPQNIDDHGGMQSWTKKGSQTLVLNAACKEEEGLSHGRWMEGQGPLVDPIITNGSKSPTLSKDHESTISTAGLLTPSHSALPDPHGQLPASYSHPIQMPAYMPLSGTSPFIPSSAFPGPPPPLGPHLGDVNSSIADSSRSVGVVSLSPPVVAMQIPRGPVPPLLPSYLGISSVGFSPCIPNSVETQQTSFHPHNVEEMQHQSHFWQQQEQEQVQQFRLVRPLSTSAVPRLPQEADLMGFEMDMSSKAGVTQGLNAGRKGSSGAKESKAAKDRGPSSNTIASVNGGFSEAAGAGNVAVLAKQEPATGRLFLRLEDEAVEATQSFVQPLPSLASGSVVYPNLLPRVSLQPMKAPLPLSGSDTQTLPSYPSATVQPFDRTTLVPAVIPSPSNNQLALPSIVVPLPVGHPSALHPPIVEISSTVPPSQEPAIDNRLVPGASSMYYSAGGSFPMFDFYNPLFTVPASSDHGLGIDLVSRSIPYISQENGTSTMADGGNYQINSAPQVYFGVGERLKAAGVPVSAGSQFDNRFVNDASEEAVLEPSRDLLSSDFVNHLRNLEFGRLCQDPGTHSFVLSPSILPSPKYIHGHLFWEDPRRPMHGDIHMLSQVPSNGQGPIPGSPLVQGFAHMTGSVPNTFSGQVGFGIGDLQRPRSGTGTYLPSPRYGSHRDRQSSGGRNQQGIYSQDQDRTGNLGYNLRHRSVGRGLSSSEGHFQVHNGGGVGIDRQTGEGKFEDRNRPENIFRKSLHLSPAYSSDTSSLALPCPPYGAIAGFPDMNLSDSSSCESSGIVTLPPSHSPGDVLPLIAEQLEFGSLGPVQIGTVLGETKSGQGVGALYRGRPSTSVTGSDAFQSLPDRGMKQTLLTAQQRTTPRTYQLKEDDFPPLPLHGQQGSSSVLPNGNNRGSHH